MCHGAVGLVHLSKVSSYDVACRARFQAGHCLLVYLSGRLPCLHALFIHLVREESCCCDSKAGTNWRLELVSSDCVRMVEDVAAAFIVWAVFPEEGDGSTAPNSIVILSSE